MADLALELIQKMRIQGKARIELPFDLDRAGNAADEIQFGARAHIHEFGARGKLQDFVGLTRREGTLVRQIQGTGALLGQDQYVAEFSHCRCGD